MAGKHGGPRPNSGRKPKSKKLSNYEKAIKLLDDNVESALNVLVNIMVDKESDDKDKMRAAEILLKKALPDKKHVVNEGGPSQIQLLIKGIDEAVKKHGSTKNRSKSNKKTK